MKIYFEINSLNLNEEFSDNIPTIIISNKDGYSNMIKNAKNAFINNQNIYTNELALLGAEELFGDKITHKIMIKNKHQKWVSFNPYILKNLGSPINIEQFFRRHICK